MGRKSKNIVDVLWDDNPVDITAEANFIWGIANKLRGSYMPDKYGDVIIPMTIIRRFECALAKTKANVVKQYEANANTPVKVLCRQSGKDKTKLDKFYENKPAYDSIIAALNHAVSDKKWLSPKAFLPVLTKVLANIAVDKIDKKLLDKIADGLSVMDKTAEIQKDKKGSVIYDKATKDTEIVKYDETIEAYMAREVLPHLPDAQWFWEEDLTKPKNPIIRTGAEIPFTRYFYKYQQPTPSKELEARFIALENSVSERIKKLFGSV